MSSYSNHAGGFIPCNVMLKYLQKHDDCITLDYAKVKCLDKITLIPIKFKQEDGSITNNIQLASGIIKTQWTVYNPEYDKLYIKSAKFNTDNFTKDEESGNWIKKDLPSEEWLPSDFYSVIELISTRISNLVNKDYAQGIIGKPTIKKKVASDEKVKVYALHKDNKFYGPVKTHKGNGDPYDNPFTQLELRLKVSNKKPVIKKVDIAGIMTDSQVLNCVVYDQSRASPNEIKEGKLLPIDLTIANVNDIIPHKTTVNVMFSITAVKLHKQGYGIDLWTKIMSVKRPQLNTDLIMPSLSNEDEEDEEDEPLEDINIAY